MRRIAHISDLHFCRTDPAAVEALAAELNADPPDLVAVSGDLTMRARSREFRAARAFLDGLRAPVLAVPGNHDITSYWLHERLLDPLGRWRRFIAEEPEPVWADGEIAVVGHLVAWIRQEFSRIRHLWRLIDSEILSLFSGLAYPCNKVARIGGVDALSPTRVPGHARRTYSGRPRSSMRFSTWTAIATSVA